MTRPISTNDVMHALRRHLGEERMNAVLCSSRVRGVGDDLGVCVWCLRHCPSVLHSFPEIARILLRRGHSTVHTAYGRFYDRVCEFDREEIRREIVRLCGMRAES